MKNLNLYIFCLSFAILNLLFSNAKAQEAIPVLDDLGDFKSDSSVFLDSDKRKFTGQNFDNLPWKNSVMFNDRAVRSLYSALNSRTLGTKAFVDFSDPQQQQQNGNNLPGNEFSDFGDFTFPDDNFNTGNDGLAGIQDTIIDNLPDSVVDKLGVTPKSKQGPIPTSAPAFHLNSILFYSPENWTVWVNKRRIRKNTELRRLKISKITPKYVEFVWYPINLDVISPDWALKVSPISEIGKEEEEEEEGFDKYGFERGIISQELPEYVETENDENVESPETVETNIDDIVTPTEEPEAQIITENNDINLIDEPENDDPIEEKIISILPEIDYGESNNDEYDADSPLKEVSKIIEDETLPTELELPPLYAQEDFSINLSSLTSLLREEENEIIAAEKAAEELRLAQEAADSIIEPESSDKKEYNAFEDSEIPFLWEYSSRDGNILIDSINGVVQFRIGINQTFVSRNMSVAEGFVSSTILATKEEVEELSAQDLERALFK